MDTCGVCGTFYGGEAYIVRGKTHYVCPACVENAKHNLVSICPKCGYSSWLNTDATLRTLTFASLLCPDCCEEFHTIDGFKRRRK